MKIRKHLILSLLILSLLLSACGAVPAEETDPTVLSTEASTEPVAEETEPTVEKPAFMENLHYQPELSETVLPEKDEATGTLFFYLNGKAVHAGGPVSDLVDVGIFTYTDLTETIQPWHMSGVIRVQIDLPDVSGDDEPYVFFVAMNASDEPHMISECILYSITINYEKGISFGSGKEKEPFVTGTTTKDELVAVYGEPTYIDSLKQKYEELFYYQPFSSVSFLCKQGVVRQISAYYCANVYGSLAENLDFDLTGTAMENDALILLSQYMDVMPYLPEEEAEEEEQTAAAATEPAEEEQEEEDKTGILSSFDEAFELDGKKIKFGTKVSDLPSPFKDNLIDLTMPVNRNYYTRTGRGDPEEFFLINSEGQINMKSDTLVVKGVIVENPNYRNWGFDNSAFHNFSCQGVTQDSTIDQVLELLGQPREMLFTSGERNCFVWMHYESENGDLLRIRVDPYLNQVIEVNMSKYFENEHSY